MKQLRASFRFYRKSFRKTEEGYEWELGLGWNGRGEGFTMRSKKPYPSARAAQEACERVISGLRQGLSIFRKCHKEKGNG